MSTQPKKEIGEGSRRLVGSRWTQNKSWRGAGLSTKPKKEIFGRFA